ncbi:MAG: hypothetical protein J0L75_16750 [Spirochaetes bacterium]|nr:hypothetical protein [Spirochaetota bacterium]
MTVGPETLKNLSQFIGHFGEDYRKALEELTYHDAFKAQINRLRGEYADLREEAILWNKRLAGNPGMLAEIGTVLGRRHLPHLETVKKVVTDLIETSKFVSRPSWHKLKESCEQMIRWLEAVRSEAALSQPVAPSTSESPATGETPPAPLSVSLEERLRLEQAVAEELDSYRVDREEMEAFAKEEHAPKETGFLGRLKKSLGTLGSEEEDNGDYRMVLRRGFVSLESFKAFREPFSELLALLRAELERDRHPALPIVPCVYQDESGYSGKRRILFAPLFANSELLLKLLSETRHDVPAAACTAAFFRPAFRYLGEVRTAWDWLKTHRQAALHEPPEYKRHAALCVGLLKDLSARMAESDTGV